MLTRARTVLSVTVMAGALAVSACAYPDRALDAAASPSPPKPGPAVAELPDSPPAPQASPAARDAGPAKPAPRPQIPRQEASVEAAPQPRAIDRPLVTIRFNRPDVDYAQSLYEAVSQALERKPSATFTVEAVAPTATTAEELASNAKTGREHAQDVLQSLRQMGMPADRLSLSATMTAEASTDEVRVYVH